VGSDEDGYIRSGWDRLRGEAVLGVNVVHPLVTDGDFVVYFPPWRRGSSQITLEFLISHVTSDP